MAMSPRVRRAARSRPIKQPTPGISKPGRRQRFGRVLGLVGVVALALAIALGPMLAGSLDREAMLGHLPERIVLGLFGIVAVAAGWVLSGSDDVVRMT